MAHERLEHDVDVYLIAMLPDWVKGDKPLTCKDYQKRNPRAPVILCQDEYERNVIEAKGKELFIVLN